MLIKQKYLKTLFWLSACLVLVLSSLPVSGTPSIQHFDKFAHFLTFFSLSILLLFAYNFRRPFLTTAILMTLFGLGIELLHLYIPFRVFSFYDFVADVMGIAAAFLVFKLIDTHIQLA